VVDGGVCAKDDLLRRGLPAYSNLYSPYGEPVVLFAESGLCMVIAEKAFATLAIGREPELSHSPIEQCCLTEL
jgi:hypothetical protein